MVLVSDGTTPHGRQRLNQLVMLYMLTSFASAAPLATSPFRPGAHGVGSFTPMQTNIKWNMHVWYATAAGPWYATAAGPNSSAATTLPMMLFVGGFDQPTSQYNQLLSAVAAHGVIVVGLGWKLSLSVNFTLLAEEVGGVLSYASSGALAADLSRQPQPALALPNASALFLGAHSIGAAAPRQERQPLWTCM